MSTFELLRNALGLPPEFEGWAEGRDLAEREYATQHDTFLSPSFVDETCRALRMPPDVRQAFLDAAERLHARPDWKRMLWQAYFRYALGAQHGLARPKMPTLPKSLDSLAPMFYALLVIAALPRTRARHAALGIDEAVTLETFDDLERWMRPYRDHEGVWGFDNPEWLQHHIDGSLFKLGRLQFEMRRWEAPFRVYRRRDTRRVLAFAPDGARFRRDGLFDGVNGIHDPEVWTASFLDDGTTLRGHPIDAAGRAQPQSVSEARDAWDLMLAPGDPSLGVHIPAGEPLQPEGCLESLRRATAFFARHFPEFAWRAFECESWLLDGQLAQHLPPASNIVQFQRLFHLLPDPEGSDTQTLERVFDWCYKDAASAPRDTRLRRAILEFMERGGRWCSGIGVLLPDEKRRA
jgi:hypothetical protein